MTALSTLFPSSGGGALPYISGNTHFVSRCDNPNSTSLSFNRDNMWPFVPRADVTVSDLAWHRYAATAADVYVGIYSGDGASLLSDCAVDSATTTGMHIVSCTDFDLTAGELYWCCLNQSAQVAAGDFFGAFDEGTQVDAERFMAGMGINFDLYSTFRSYNMSDGNGHMYKARTTAALPASQTMSSWLQETSARSANIGFVAA